MPAPKVSKAPEGGAAVEAPTPKAFPLWTVNGVTGSVLLDAADVADVVYHPTKDIVRVTTKGNFLLQLATDRKEFAIWWGSK